MESADLLSIEGHGPAWGTATADLNATLLIWRQGEGQPLRVNADLDVILLVLQGSGVVSVDGIGVEAAPGRLVVIPRGSPREIVAGAAGMRCLTVHRRRDGLTIRNLADA